MDSAPDSNRFFGHEAVDADNRETAAALVEVLTRGTCLALIGAGASIPAGYPSWPGLLSELASELMRHDPWQESRVASLADEDDLLWRASELRQLLGPHYEPFMHRRFGPERAPIADLHRTLVRLPVRHVLTTNYDAVLESAHEAEFGRGALTINWTDKQDVRDLLLRTDEPESAYERRYVHLHGRFNRPDSLVLTDADYNRRYVASQETFRKLFGLLATRPLLSVGFSLSDPDVMHVFRSLQVDMGAGESSHFAIMPAWSASDAIRQRRRLQGRFGVRGLFFQVVGNDFSGLHDWLRELERMLTCDDGADSGAEDQVCRPAELASSDSPDTDGPDSDSPDSDDPDSDDPGDPDDARSDAPLPGPLRLLLLATDRDLAEARERTAEHLRVALGVEVTTDNATSEHDPQLFEHVLLLQGWWWDGGGAADIWRRAVADERSILLVDEDSDSWPPRSRIEIAANDEIAAFRAELTAPVLFQHPDQLGELVNRCIAQVVESRARSNQELGLRSWERRYLEQRLPAWRAGRTASGGSHLMDAQAQMELYRPELYIPLTGACPRWMLFDGALRSYNLLEDGPPPVELERLSRLPLARWLCEPSIPRLVLVGAPGGGKTVFLTRAAAALAATLLGRGGHLERIDFDAVRSLTGRLPIPVLLDAPAIAEYLDAPGLAPILRALARECRVDGEGPIDEAEIRDGLEHGRYWLFIDALDEVADASKRHKLIDALKGMANQMPTARVTATTRSARYTGSLSLGPELEVIDIAPMDDTQIERFCARWARARTRDARYLQSLQLAVAGLGESIEGLDDDQAITGNPLMLTAICLVFERRRALPDERAQLCSLLVDDLVRSRESRSAERGWSLSDVEKRDLLERIALAMQLEGAQSWPVARAEEIALRSIPTRDVERQERATRYVQWAAEHTGLLRFEQPEDGPERVRFWHRLFREYLSASRLSRLDRTVHALVEDLWQRGKLGERFFTDVIRLLPGAFGERDRANALVQALRELAAAHPEQRGRLHGLVAAAIIESRALFPEVDVPAMAEELAELWEREGADWEEDDQQLLLDSLGRLDPLGGDPRLRTERWLSMAGGTVEVMFDPQELEPNAANKVDVRPFQLSWAPVTVQEYRLFMDAENNRDDRFWRGVPEHHRSILAEDDPKGWQRQLRRPNWPVDKVTFVEATAYCRWRTAARTDGRSVRLIAGPEAWTLGRDLSLSTFFVAPVGMRAEAGYAWTAEGGIWGSGSEVMPSFPSGASASVRAANLGIRCVLVESE